MPPSTGAHARSGRAARKAFTPSVFVSRMRRARSADAVELVEGDDAQALGGVRGDDAEEVVEPPHPAREVGVRDRPAAPQARQAVGLRQAGRHHELGPEVRRRARGPARDRERLEVHLVHEDAGADRARGVPHRAQVLRRDEGARGVVEVREDDEARARRERPLHLARVEPEALLRAPREAPHVEAQPAGRVHEQRVGRLLDQHLVAGLGRGRQDEQVGHRGAGRVHDPVGVHPGLARQPLLQRGVAVGARAADLERPRSGRPAPRAGTPRPRSRRG